MRQSTVRILVKRRKPPTISSGDIQLACWLQRSTVFPGVVYDVARRDISSCNSLGWPPRGTSVCIGGGARIQDDVMHD